MLKAIKIAGAVSVASAAVYAYQDYTSSPSSISIATSHCLRDTQLLCKEPYSKWNWNWDKRHTYDVVDGTEKIIKKHYIFIRHGQYNINGYDDEEKYLTRLGREQAKMTGERLSKLGFKYSRVVQSSMKRAKETCSIITDQISDLPIVETSDLLREGSPILPDPLHRANEPELKYFSDAPRIESAFRKFVHRPSTSIDVDGDHAEIYVCHANVIRYFICRLGQFPPQGWLRMSLKHGSITWITVFSDGSAVINCIGDSGFMSSSKLSS